MAIWARASDLRTDCGPLLGAGERLLAAEVARPTGVTTPTMIVVLAVVAGLQAVSVDWSRGIVIDALLGAVLGLVVSRAAIALANLRARRDGRPVRVSARMGLLLTDERLVVTRLTPAVRLSPSTVLGEVPWSEVESIRHEPSSLYPNQADLVVTWLGHGDLRFEMREDAAASVVDARRLAVASA